MFNSEDFLNLIPIISVVIVAVLGFVSSLLITRVSQKHNVSTKIIEQYFKVREDITQKISEFTNLSTMKILDETRLVQYNEQISKIYYQYYDFLPKEILYDLLCLHCTLSDKANRLFKIKEKKLTVLDETELEAFLQSISAIEGAEQFIFYKLKSDDINVRRSTSIILQSRKVLVTMNEFFTLKNLLKWIESSRK